MKRVDLAGRAFVDRRCPDPFDIRKLREHDWRLQDRVRVSTETGLARVAGQRVSDRDIYREVWYCARCRKVEEREVAGG